MARLKTVVDECLTVANASIDISSSTYNELGAVNWEDNDKDYPLFLFDKRSVEIAVDKFTRTNLPSRSTYTQTIYFFDTYLESEKSSTDLQTKQDALMVIADQYFAELRGRNATGNNGFYVGDINLVKPLDETHNERLIQLSYEVELQVMREDCTLGTFNYAGVEQPTDLSCTSTTDSAIVIGWTDNATAETAYEVWRSSDGNSFSLIDTIAADSTGYTDSLLPSETAYAYKVRAIDASNNGKFSDQILCCTDSTGTTCLDATVENSDQSYQNTVASGATLVLPDISFTDSDGSVSLVASVVDISATQCTAQSGIAYFEPSTTGSVTSYRTGDDAWRTQNGEFDFTNPAYPESYAQLDYSAVNPHLTLLNNNAFGNKNRFTDDLGTAVYTNNLMIDHHCNRMWYLVRQGTSNWNNSIDNSVASTQGGFTNWYLPTMKEYESLLDLSLNDTLGFSPFSGNATGDRYWTSSTNQTSTGSAYVIEPRNSTSAGYNVLRQSKSISYYYLLVRRHYNL